MTLTVALVILCNNQLLYISSVVPRLAIPDGEIEPTLVSALAAKSWSSTAKEAIDAGNGK